MVEIGTVETFPDVIPDKAQAVKILEEAGEVLGALQSYHKAGEGWSDVDEHNAGMMVDMLDDVLDECADVIQATCNLISALGVTDFTPFVDRCERRNIERGRL